MNWQCPMISFNLKIMMAAAAAYHS
jgi:hypothetical protein